MGVPFYIMCLDLFMVDDASEAVEELNRLKLKNAWLKKTLQALKKRRKEMKKKFAEENKKWVAEIEESKLIAFEEQIKKIEQLNAYAIQTRRGGTLDWVYKSKKTSTKMTQLAKQVQSMRCVKINWGLVSYLLESDLPANIFSFTKFDVTQ